MTNRLVKHYGSPELAFGRVLRALRNERRITQEALSHESGVQRNFISLIELGRNQPTIKTLFKLAKALDISPAKMIEMVEAEIHHQDQP